ncbi:MAG: cupin domain-containing protein [Desulfobacterota bacterium]|nr:cupin domain-containing protein [Thermodesulfobacteriota bacterium]
MNALQLISLPENFRQEPRGWSFSPFRERPWKNGLEIDWASFHLVSLEPGSIRGNHVHPRVTEWLLFLGAPFLLVWQDEGSVLVQQRRIDDHHTLVVIPPRVKHAVQNLSPGPLYLTAFRSLTPGSAKEETVAAPLIAA